MMSDSVNIRLILVSAMLLMVLNGPAVEGIGKFTNVAVGKNAHQISTIYGLDPSRAAPPERANDGNKSECSLGVACSKTNHHTNAYWRVEFGQPYVIDHVIIYNRIDAVESTYASDVSTEVAVYNTPANYTEVCFHAGQIPDIYTCTPSTRYPAGWLKVKLAGANHLTLCEVEVMVAVEERSNFVRAPSVQGAGSVIETKTVVSAIQCACHCQRNTNCDAYHYITNTDPKTCELLGANTTTASADAEKIFWALK